jgi:hypothetical protein
MRDLSFLRHRNSPMSLKGKENRMGFDLIGRYPVSEKGSYFRMNQFMWPPFVDLLHDICARDTPSQVPSLVLERRGRPHEKDALALAKDLQQRQRAPAG